VRSDRSLQLLNFDFDPNPAFHSDANLHPAFYLKVEKLLVIEIFNLVFFSVEPTCRWQTGRTFRLFIIGRNIPWGGASNSTAQVQFMGQAEIPLTGNGSRFNKAPYRECYTASYS
jgi:hypothetical protein